MAARSTSMRCGSMAAGGWWRCCQRRASSTWTCTAIGMVSRSRPRACACWWSAPLADREKKKAGAETPALDDRSLLVGLVVGLAARSGRLLDDRDLNRLRDRDQDGLAGHGNRAGRVTVAEGDDLDQIEVVELVLLVLRG